MTSVISMDKNIVVKRLEVLSAQASSSRFSVAVVNQAHATVVITRDSILIPVYEWLFKMMVQNMFRLTFHKFKVFYAIISFDMILMMNFLSRQQLTPKVLLHNVAVVKHALAIYIYTQVTKRGKQGLAFLEVVPVRRNVVVSMSLKSTAVHFTDIALFILKDSDAPFNLAYFTNHYPNRSALCL